MGGVVGMSNIDAAWLARIDGLGNFTTATTTKASFTFDSEDYEGGLLSVSPPNEVEGRQDQWALTIAAHAASTRADVFAVGAPVAIELELIHDAGSGWVSSGVVARGHLSAPVWLDTGEWRIQVDTSPGDADLGDPLMWNSVRDPALSKLGPEAESVVLAWPPGEN